jgi:hypothetical protein
MLGARGHIPVWMKAWARITWRNIDHMQRRHLETQPVVLNASHPTHDLCGERLISVGGVPMPSTLSASLALEAGSWKLDVRPTLPSHICDYTLRASLLVTHLTKSSIRSVFT